MSLAGEPTADHLKSLTGLPIHCTIRNSRFAAQAELTAKELGFQLFHVVLNDAESKADLLGRFAESMNFPSYFGQNWDALLDCLRDLSWANGAGYLVMIEGLDEFKARCSGEGRVVSQILSDATSDWRALFGRPFFVLLLVAGRCTEVLRDTGITVCEHGD